MNCHVIKFQDNNSSHALGFITPNLAMLTSTISYCSLFDSDNCEYSLKYVYFFIPSFLITHICQFGKRRRRGRNHFFQTPAARSVLSFIFPVLHSQPISHRKGWGHSSADASFTKNICRLLLLSLYLLLLDLLSFLLPLSLPYTPPPHPPPPPW